MGHFIKKASSIGILIISILLVSACQQKQEEINKLKDLDFTVVEEADIPEELLNMIQEKKQNVFKLSYSSKGNEYRYIVVGYGAQNTGGYSISVEELFLTENAIYIDTTLIGPGKEELVTQVITYPYICIKIEYIDKSVVFE